MLLFLLCILPLAVIGDELPVNGNRIARPIYGIPRPQPRPLYIKTLEPPYTTAAPIPFQVPTTTNRPFSWSAYYKNPLVAQPQPQPAEIIIEKESEAFTVPSQSYVTTQRTFTWPAGNNAKLIPNPLEHSHPVAPLSTIAAPIALSSAPTELAVSSNAVALPLSTPRPFITTAPVEISTQKQIIYESKPNNIPVIEIEVEIDPYTGEVNRPGNTGQQYEPSVSNPVKNPTPVQPVVVPQPAVQPEPSYTIRPAPVQQVIVPQPTPVRPVIVPQPAAVRPVIVPQPAPVRPVIEPQPAVQPQPLYTIIPAPVRQVVVPRPAPASRSAQINVKYESCTQGHGYYSVPQECDSYIECNKKGQAKIFCPDGLLFNPAVVWPEYPCAYPTDVKCEGQIVQPPQPSDSCPRQYGYFPAPDGDCGNYLMCQAGIAMMMHCPAGLAFNTISNSCDWPDNVGSCSSVSALQGFVCPEPQLDDSGKPSEIITKYRYGQSCNQYIGCQSGHPRLLSCDIGSSFDEASQMCVSADLVSNCQ